jgi:large subunit ribosomal protein L13e
MSFEFAAEPRVKSPGKAVPRRGRGFSIDETKQAGLAIEEARRMGLIIDLRRKTTHEENVEALKQYVKDLDDLVAELTKTEVAKPKPTKKDDKAVKELSSLRAVKKEEAEQLVAAGIKSLSDLAYCDIDKVAKKTDIDEDRITAMVKAALKKI